jgi:HK97 family phage major capsid protein
MNFGLKALGLENEEDVKLRVEAAKARQELAVNTEEDAVLRALGMGSYETNANEVEHTASTGYGKELLPVNILSEKVVDVSRQMSKLLQVLPGNHGTNMNLTEKVPVMGDAGYMESNSEWTTGAGTIAQGTNLQPTADITITQVPLIMSIDVSRRLLKYSVVDLEAWLINQIGKASAKTIESMIINGDAETGATGNVNSDDQAPATTFTSVGGAGYHMLLIDHGIRELGINGSSTSSDLGTLARADFGTMENILGDFFANAEECLWITNRKTYNKFMQLTDFSYANYRGLASTLTGAAVTNIDGADLIISQCVPLTEADGKVSKTAGNNTLGQILLIWKPAVQYGWGQPLEIDIVKVPGKGVQVLATMEFGFTIVQKKAGNSDSSVAVGYNATV